MSVVGVWTGREPKLLRLARRMTVRQFAEHLGVTSRMVSKWEAGDRRVRPRPYNQATLDESLRRCTEAERERFLTWLRLLDEEPKAVVRVQLVVDVPAEQVGRAGALAAAVRAMVEAGSVGTDPPLAPLSRLRGRTSPCRTGCLDAVGIGRTAGRFTPSRKAQPATGHVPAATTRSRRPRAGPLAAGATRGSLVVSGGVARRACRS